jgi:hypothetical protein
MVSSIGGRKRFFLVIASLGICCLLKSQVSLGAAKPRQAKPGILLGFYFMASPLGSDRLIQTKKPPVLRVAFYQTLRRVSKPSKPSILRARRTYKIKNPAGFKAAPGTTRPALA